MVDQVSGSSLTGGRRHGASVKTLKRMLKKAGLKTTGRKAALTRRAKKAHLKMRGGGCSDATKMTKEECVSPATWTDDAAGGRRRRGRGSRRGIFGKLL